MVKIHSSLIHFTGLACEDANRYPSQLKQALSLLEHLLQVEKLSPSAITLMGDSAGGHLLLSLLLHLRHPNPLVSPFGIKERLGGAVLVSPWVSMTSSADSMQSNKRKDILSVGALAYWARNFLGEKPFDFWNAPLTAPEEWWSDLLVHEILVVYGEDELLRDDIDILCERLKVNRKFIRCAQTDQLS
jgi:acetyl esterase/lipase